MLPKYIQLKTRKQSLATYNWTKIGKNKWLEKNCRYQYYHTRHVSSIYLEVCHTELLYTMNFIEFLFLYINTREQIGDIIRQKLIMQKKTRFFNTFKNIKERSRAFFGPLVL